MSRGSHIVAVGEGHASPTAEISASEAEIASEGTEAAPPWDEPETDDAPPRRTWDTAFAGVAILAAIGWTGFFAWSQRTAMFSPASPQQWAGWIASWSTPVLLIGVVWLIAMRNSRREASRFGAAAQLLARESSLLEDRLSAVNRELSLAREFLAAQSRDLSALGRLATERLSTNADRLQALIHENGAQLDGIGAVSSAALDNMERLRGQLPVIASTAKDVTNSIANAGRTAHAQLQEMVHGFNRLNEFGQASDRQVNTIREKVGESLLEFASQAEQLEAIARDRFAALAEQGEAFRAELDGHEVEALAAIRSRATALSAELAEARQALDRSEAESLTSLRARLSTIRDEGAASSRAFAQAEAEAIEGWRGQVARIEAELRGALASLDQANGATAEAARERLEALAEEAGRFDESLAERSRNFSLEMERRHGEAEAREAAAIALIGERLDALDRDIAARGEQHRKQAAAIAEHGEAVAVRLGDLDTRLVAIAGHGAEARESLTGALRELASHLAQSRQVLAGTDSEIAQLTEASVRLLELIQAGANHSRNELPSALAQGESRLEAVAERVFALRDAVNEASGKSDNLSAYVLAASDAVRGTMQELDALHDRIDERTLTHARKLDELSAGLTAIGAESADLAARARGELSSAIEELAASARSAVAALESDGAAAVTGLAGKLDQESRAVIDRVMEERSAELAGNLEEAAAKAAGLSREATIQLRDQLAKVNELAGNLERRVTQAREKAEEQVDNDFARRVALITESLNSHAIDIAKALSNEVSDTAWSAYLKGDRGIFTRRAVSLLDNTEARAIVQLYETDREFSAHVNRYIHDFEAMLRQLLSTRDGHALGVTLLSSDMGKLYVVLAQGIERLRN